MNIISKVLLLANQNGGGDTQIAKVASSQYTTFFLTTDGELYGCGNGSYGQQGQSENIYNTGTNFSFFTKYAENVRDVICYATATWYLTNDDELYGCGYNGHGEQGAGNTTNVTTFTKRAENVADVVCSDSVTWYITNDDELYGCGYNGSYNQGVYDDGDITTFTKRAENVKKVVCSLYTTWYINNNNELYGCGGNAYGQQGDGTTTDVTTFTKRADYVKQVSCSGSATWYINTLDELYGCGHNNGNQGDGTTTNVTTFTKRADNVKQVVNGNSVTFYIDKNSNLYGCGSNNYGQQGNGTTTNQLTFENKMPYFRIMLQQGAGSIALEAGKYFLELVGGGSGSANSRSAYASTLSSSAPRCAQAVAGGSAGAAFVGIVNLTEGTYTLTQAVRVAGDGSTAYSQNEASVSSLAPTSTNSSTFSKNGTNLIVAGGASRGSSWADYNASPYFNGTAGTGGTLTILDNSIIVSSTLSTNGTAGTFGGGRNTSTSGSQYPANGKYTEASNTYLNYGGANAATGLSRISYLPYAS